MVSTTLDNLQQQVAALSLDELLELQTLINTELRQRVGSKSNGRSANGASPQPTAKAENHSFLDDIPGMLPQPTEEELDAEIRQMFSPEDLAAADKIDFNEVINRPLPKSWSEMLIEMRGGDS